MPIVRPRPRRSPSGWVADNGSPPRPRRDRPRPRPLCGWLFPHCAAGASRIVRLESAPEGLTFWWRDRRPVTSTIGHLACRVWRCHAPRVRLDVWRGISHSGDLMRRQIAHVLRARRCEVRGKIGKIQRNEALTAGAKTVPCTTDVWDTQILTLQARRIGVWFFVPTPILIYLITCVFRYISLLGY